MDFAGCSLTMLDASLLSAFVERWHPETSSFHHLFEEMKVTLDDVDALFHIPIDGTFFTPVYRDQATVVRMVMDALEVNEVDMLREFGETRGFHLRMSWLKTTYQELVDAERYQAAARAYMLHLMACTLFVDKSGVYIDVRYISLFSALDTPCWARGVAALTMLYMALDVASSPDTKQLAGYQILCWIYEHFPHICERKIQRVVATDPSHCTRRPFEVSTSYSGYARWESHVARHLPERCLRQYDYIQGIPCSVLEAPAGGIDR
ncbi:protein MAIN-LIKE 2-like [Vicia villosa]|uniref:protein MAIN-LIKE 2-like n=1 Tax=Vicia villosa TaxID=3911 RepID=UPI00273AA3AB|nr:protein MAIN-LIKE 2-like [Vicia villosa]